MARFNCRAVEAEGSWTAEITRKKTAKTVVITKSKPGFSSESEAKEWADKELVTFVDDLNQRNRRTSIDKKVRTQ